MAVLVALFSLILLGALTTAMVFAAGEEARASAGKLGATQAIALAEEALTGAVTSTDWGAMTQLRPGQYASSQLTVPGDVAVMITRLDTTCFFIQAITPHPSAGPVNGRIVRRVALTIELSADSAGVLRALRVPKRGWAELF